MAQSSQTKLVKLHGKVLHGLVLAREDVREDLSEMTAQMIEGISSGMDIPEGVSRTEVLRFFSLSYGFWTDARKPVLKLTVSKKEASSFFLDGEIPTLLKALKQNGLLHEWNYSASRYEFEVYVSAEAISGTAIEAVQSAILEIKVLTSVAARKWKELAQELPASLRDAAKYEQMLDKHGLYGRTLEKAARGIFEGYQGLNFAQFEPVHYETDDISEEDAGRVVACLRDLGFIELSEDANDNLLLRPRISSFG